MPYTGSLSNMLELRIPSGFEKGAFFGQNGEGAPHDSTLVHMPPVQPWCGNGADEELGAVGVLPSVGHGQHARAGVLLTGYLGLHP